MTAKLQFTKPAIRNAAAIATQHGVAVKLAADGSLIIFPDAKSVDTTNHPVDEKGKGYL